MLTARDLSYVVDGRALLRGISVDIGPGTVHAVLGPNGAGKTTLLRLLSGELPPHSGTITYAGRPLQAWSPQQLARLRAVLPQREQLGFAFTVEEVVALGRLPCPRHRIERETEIIAEAMKISGISHLRTRRYPTLSGGERARVHLARVLAQIWEPVELGPRALMLDEPTANLDLAYQHHCLRLARRFAAQGVAVLLVLHDPNLVLAYADTATLLCCGEVIAQGAPAEILTAARLTQVYGVPINVMHDGARPWIRVAVDRIGPP